MKSKKRETKKDNIFIMKRERKAYTAATMAETNTQRREQNGDQNLAEYFTRICHFDRVTVRETERVKYS